MDNIFNIAEKYRNIFDNLEINEDGEILNIETLEAIEDEFNNKAKNIAFHIRELKLLSKACKEEAERYTKKSKSYDKEAERLKRLIVDGLKLTPTQKVKDMDISLWIKTTEATQIVDEFQIPEMYWKETIKKEPDITKIKEAFAQGIKVPGAVIVENENLQIR